MLILAASSVVAQEGLEGGDSDQGKKILGQIEMEGGGMPPERYEVIIQKVTGAGDRRIFSDTTGKFRLSNVNPGTYTITVNPRKASGFIESTAEIIINAGGGEASYFVTLFLKRAGSDVTIITQGRTLAATDSDATVSREARKHYKKGHADVKAGHVSEAEAEFRAALEIAPDYLFALNDLGVLLTRTGRFADSIPLLRRAIIKSPKSFPPHLNLAIALLGEGMNDEAATELQLALAIEPSAHDALFMKGLLERRLGHPEAAIEAFRRAFDVGGVDAILAQFELGQLYDQIGQQHAAALAYTTFIQFVKTGPQAEIAKKRLKSMGVG